MAIAVIQNKTIILKDKKKTIVKEEPVTINQPIIAQQQFTDDIYGEETGPIKVVDVDVKRQYNMTTVDTNNIKSDVINTKVKNRVADLRRLRRGN